MTKLLVSGGCLRENGFELGEGKYYAKAVLLTLDLLSGDFEIKLSKQNGGANYPEIHPNQQFTAACLDDDILWLPTDTEILKYQLPKFELLATFSHPCFHNIHSVYAMGDDLLVTSTGLDNVVRLNKHTGEILENLNAQGKDPWHRYDPEIDYRLVHSTRPHDSHPNFVFEINGEPWVTRCTQEDAVKLNDIEQRIDLTQSANIAVHDGLYWHDKIVFTRVDGQLIICDPVSKKVLETHNPFQNKLNKPVGWCRGLYINGDTFYLGYSKLRKTKLKAKLKFLAKGNLKYSDGNNSLIVCYNMATQQVERIYETPDGLIDAIYGILPYNYD